MVSPNGKVLINYPAASSGASKGHISPAKRGKPRGMDPRMGGFNPLKQGTGGLV